MPGDSHIAGSVLYLDIMTAITEITFLTGERCLVEGDAKHVERLIIDAARGSIMQLAWLTDAEARRTSRGQSRKRCDAPGTQA